ncbi:MAG TPA: hypothetical protein DDX89_04845 [Candidatus Omnitrophica bacterium]|nr:MAG: hypothetical protein A2Z92_06205 [Omnitrophica WOR_2 bacterium GWA2_63_20]OGX17598.1 MAG: hypothetical protein A2105_02810 [Omnitrophica WOR_2 bacterium GWF2_63_9]OGX36448.1 MAG: hypothetical protein A3B73_01045 [Omnitrophica WOR_2 bacterium RIFCSPHIGHO2_02_FULL_63_39]OGX44848.1 MAG: hypothetical protein A3I71_04290 [Omnitrophica WOR_2 bacterium RIFCSPLOWO2_02_FULL_63_16]OGX48079.1 MAG: hypothetical protein A3G88_01950 [Omnitrophica WOR_2 bacterium RIFCSPLOWO2_12_FULL_63_16]HBH97104.1 
MRRLLIFLKDPVPGQVKTRLAKAVGSQAACDIYRACVELTLERMMRFRQEAVLCVDPPEALLRTRAWVGADWRLQPQRGLALGERLADATAVACSDGASQVVVIGTDSPWLTGDDVAAAFEALRYHHIVLGPAQDGGYYLIGLTRPQPALFEGIAWSSPSVYAQTRVRAAQLGLTTHSLREGYDVDRLEDVQRWLKEVQHA